MLPAGDSLQTYKQTETKGVEKDTPCKWKDLLIKRNWELVNCITWSSYCFVQWIFRGRHAGAGFIENLELGRNSLTSQ